MLIFEHAVKYGGKFYPPNTPIEEAVQKAGKGDLSAEKAAAEEPAAKKAPAQKAARGRRKGDA